MNFDLHMDAAMTAIDASSELLLSRFRGGVSSLDRWEKAPGALVTEADIQSDKAIASALSDSGCGGVIVSEESYVALPGDGSADGKRVEWLVDPLCGTVPFSTGMDHWGINIAMRIGGELKLSVLATPPNGRVLAAKPDGSVELSGEAADVFTPRGGLSEVAVGLEIDGQAMWDRLLSSHGLRWVTRVGQVNTFSSAAYPIMLVCTGRLSAVVFYGIEPMHIAAGALVAERLGASVGDGFGDAVDWSKDDELSIFVVGWPNVYDDLIGALNADF